MKIPISITLLLLIMFGSMAAPAHVENDMPDSVAEMEYRILLEFKPGDYLSRIKLGMVLLNQAKFKEADKEFRTALDYSPGNQQAHIGLSLLSLKLGDQEKALELIKKAVSIDPGQGIVYLHYGQILESSSRLDEALQRYMYGLEKLDPSPESEDHHLRVRFDKAINGINRKIQASASKE